MFDTVAATEAELAAPRPGDDIVSSPDVVMDRAFTLSNPPAQVWPWLVQLGKGRAGWYLPRSIERVVPRGHRAVRTVHPEWTQLEVGDVVPDYGRNATFEVASIDPPRSLVYRSQRGRVTFTWSISTQPIGTISTRVLLRLRMAPVRRLWLAHTAGGLFDELTIAGMAAGLRERLAEHP